MKCQDSSDSASFAGSFLPRSFSAILMFLFAMTMAASLAAGKSIFDDDYEPPTRSEPAHAKPEMPPSPAEPATPTPDAPPTAPTPTPNPDGDRPRSRAPLSVEPAAPAASDGRQPIPSKADTAHSRKLMAGLYAADLADETFHGRQLLAWKLLGEEPKMEANPSDDFVVLTGAMQAAREGGDLPLCLRAADLLTKTFALDAPIVKADAAIKMSRPAYAVYPVRNVSAALEVLDQVQAADDLPTAARLSTALQPVAAYDAMLSREVQQRKKEIDAQLSARSRLAVQLEKLKKTPDDPAANLAAGISYCYGAGRWDLGLPMLAKGSDAALKGLAAAELAQPSDGEALVKLGDEWWRMGGKVSDANRAKIYAHAATLYAQAKTSITGLRGALLDKRIAEAASLNAEAAARLTLPSTPVNLIKNGDFTNGKENPDDWQLVPLSGSVSMARDTKEFAIGPASICLTIDGGKARAYAAATFDPPTEGWLRVSGIYKTSPDFKGAALIILQRGNETHTASPTYKRLAEATQQHEWTRFGPIDVPLPIKGAHEVWFNIWVSGSAGKFWADELRVEHIPANARQ